MQIQQRLVVCKKRLALVVLLVRLHAGEGAQRSAQHDRIVAVLNHLFHMHQLQNLVAQAFHLQCASRDDAVRDGDLLVGCLFQHVLHDIGALLSQRMTVVVDCVLRERNGSLRRILPDRQGDVLLNGHAPFDLFDGVAQFALFGRTVAVNVNVAIAHFLQHLLVARVGEGVATNVSKTVRKEDVVGAILDSHDRHVERRGSAINHNGDVLVIVVLDSAGNAGSSAFRDEFNVRNARQENGIADFLLLILCIRRGIRNHDAVFGWTSHAGERLLNQVLQLLRHEVGWVHLHICIVSLGDNHAATIFVAVDPILHSCSQFGDGSVLYASSHEFLQLREQTLGILHSSLKSLLSDAKGVVLHIDRVRYRRIVAKRNHNRLSVVELGNLNLGATVVDAQKWDAHDKWNMLWRSWSFLRLFVVSHFPYSVLSIHSATVLKTARFGSSV